jgi:hypothetical protein
VSNKKKRKRKNKQKVAGRSISHRNFHFTVQRNRLPFGRLVLGRERDKVEEIKSFKGHFSAKNPSFLCQNKDHENDSKIAGSRKQARPRLNDGFLGFPNFFFCREDCACNEPEEQTGRLRQGVQARGQGGSGQEGES